MALEVDYETRRKISSERRRLIVLKTAGQCFAEKGYKKTTTDEIARRSGVSKGLVFHFFGSKRRLFESIIEDSLNQWATLSEYRASGVEKNSLEELRRLFLASFDFVEQNPVLLLFVRDEEGLLESYQRSFSTRNRRWRQRIRRTLEKGVKAGELRELNVGHVSVVFHELQSALLTSISFKGKAPRYDRNTVNVAIDILLRGIEHPTIR